MFNLFLGIKIARIHELFFVINNFLLSSFKLLSEKERREDVSILRRSLAEDLRTILTKSFSVKVFNIYNPMIFNKRRR